jgi:hypothetical protein
MEPTFRAAECLFCYDECGYLHYVMFILRLLAPNAMHKQLVHLLSAWQVSELGPEIGYYDYRFL